MLFQARRNSKTLRNLSVLCFILLSLFALNSPTAGIAIDYDLDNLETQVTDSNDIADAIEPAIQRVAEEEEKSSDLDLQAFYSYIARRYDANRPGFKDE